MRGVWGVRGVLWPVLEETRRLLLQTSPSQDQEPDRRIKRGEGKRVSERERREKQGETVKEKERGSGRKGERNKKRKKDFNKIVFPLNSKKIQNAWNSTGILETGLKPLT